MEQTISFPFVVPLSTHFTVSPSKGKQWTKAHGKCPHRKSSRRSKEGFAQVTKAGLIRRIRTHQIEATVRLIQDKFIAVITSLRVPPNQILGIPRTCNTYQLFQIIFCRRTVIYDIMLLPVQ